MNKMRPADTPLPSLPPPPPPTPPCTYTHPQNIQNKASDFLIIYVYV